MGRKQYCFFFPNFFNQSSYSEKTRPQELALAVATAIAVHTGL